MRLVAAFLALVVAVGTVGLWLWHQNSTIRYERDRAKLEWQAAKLAEKVQAAGAVPDKWAAGLFLGNSSLATLTSTLKGTRIVSEQDDITVAFDDLKIVSQTTFMEVVLALTATSARRNSTIKVKAVAELVFSGTTQVDTQTATIRFGLIPIEIVPEIAWNGLDWKGGKLASDLISGELLAGMIGSVPIALPIRNGFSVDLGGERTGTVSINKALGSTLTYAITVPDVRLAGSLKAIAPLFLRSGLWLLAAEKPLDEADKLADPGATSKEDMARQTAEIRAKLQDVATPAADAAIWVGSELVLSGLKQIFSLPADQRRMRFRSTKINGQIAKKNWSDDILGDGGVFAEFVDNNSLSGAAVVSGLTSSWKAGNGVNVQTRLDVDAVASIRVHVDPLIGGGVGTTMGLNGKASAELGAGLTLKVEALDAVHVLVARPVGRCGSVKIDLRTDGKAKTDFGWTKVPTVGIIRDQPIDLGRLAPVPLFDDLPRTVDGRDREGKPFVVALKDRKVTVEPAWRYLKVSVHITKAEAIPLGWLVAANLSVAEADQPEDATALAAARARIKETISKSNRSSCAQEGATEVTLGDMKFGPNNEIVKFLVSIGKFTQDMANRIGHEVSSDKLKEWAKDPAGSFERSDPGKLIRKLPKIDLPKLPKL